MSHTGAPVDTRSVSMCETCTKQRKEKIMSSAWNSAKTDNCDVDVVEEESHFTSASAHVLIREIMVCNRDLEKIKESINDVQQKMKNIIDDLGRI
ncbi:hypothetical protein AB205_0162660 [Aquarana catesbeiana]|uniref:Uncharacterized protein n=1 Tax=Aquarana catesbeiana TaxID=8400 RepID=A0A2G9R8S5_AQUCT|nr:hypothetical protein AB205_0162660 [Aquarana catesbeiana]